MVERPLLALAVAVEFDITGVLVGHGEGQNRNVLRGGRLNAVTHRRSPSVTGGVNRRSGTSVAFERLLFLPAGGGLVVLGMRADPFFALRGVLELPERRLGLEPVDQELAGLEGGLTVR